MLSPRIEECPGKLRAVLGNTRTEKSMEEVWRAVKGYEGLYEVSNLGRVRSKDRLVKHIGIFLREAKGKVIKENTSSTGHYSSVGLHRNGKTKHFKVHRLVAIAFIPNVHGYSDINHKDENKQNNCVDNLEWCCKSYNENYGTKRTRQSQSTDWEAFRKKVSKPLYQKTLDGKIVRRWDSIAQVHRTLGYSSGNISMCCNGKLKKIYGFRWEFVE